MDFIEKLFAKYTDDKIILWFKKVCLLEAISWIFLFSAINTFAQKGNQQPVKKTRIEIVNADLLTAIISVYSARIPAALITLPMLAISALIDAANS